MKTKFVLMTLVAAFMLAGNLDAQTFSSNSKDGNKYFFSVTDTLKKEVCVIPNAKQDFSCLKTTVKIPAKVKLLGKDYNVTGIAENAFSGADSLKVLVLPETIRYISSSAFAGCDNLKDVVFPHSQVDVALDAFSGCRSIENVSFGSDWESVNFKIFMDSEKLKSLIIPSKVSSIRNIKALKYLESIVVDPNNAKFSSLNNLLMDKDMGVLFCCPSAFKGDLVVPEGVAEVVPGAISDCVGIVSIDFPKSLNKLYFREMFRLKNLEKVIFRSESPVMTALKDGKPVFALEIDATDSFKIVVPAASKKAYLQICNEDGLYKGVDGGKEVELKIRNLASKKMITFSKEL